jgi:hypothetical protein
LYTKLKYDEYHIYLLDGEPVYGVSNSRTVLLRDGRLITGHMELQRSAQGDWYTGQVSGKVYKYVGIGTRH